ncbi:MAG: peroxiredoxin [Pirellulales bacterium]|nr:peroxiredoxin [Pirellulales bacterium]
MKKIQVGDHAPEFTWKTLTGEQMHLRDFRDKKVVVLFFYPKDGTAICTKEACAFRDAYDHFAEAGAVVIGVSGDSAESHRAFTAQHNLPFHLVSDGQDSLRQAFGVPKTFGLLPGRVTYVIDEGGIVRMVFSAPLTASGHVSEALKVVGGLIRLKQTSESDVRPGGKQSCRP